MKRIYSIFLIIVLFLFSCSKDENVIETIIVASRKVMDIEPSGASEREYFLIKTNKSDKWEYLSPNIQGFNYEEGYEYMLKVRITTINNPQQDQYPKSYALIEIISKTKKQSENLPVIK